MRFFEICINWPPDIPIEFINTGERARMAEIRPTGKMIYSSKGVIEHP